MSAASPLDPPSVEQRPEAAAHDAVVVLRGASWADSQRLLEIRGESAVPRLTYLRAYRAALGG